MASTAQAWTNYRAALGAVFPEAQESLLSLVDVTRVEALDEAAIETLIQRSDALREAILPSLRSQDQAERELGALQLQAAAVLDIDSANRLAALDDDDDVTELDATVALPVSFGGFLAADDLANLEQIMATTPETASRILGNGNPSGEGTVLFQPQASNSAELKGTVDDAVDAIVADSAAFGSTTVRGLLALPGEQLLTAGTRPVKEIFDQLGEQTRERLGRIKKKAVKLFMSAVAKLLAIFGVKEDKVREKVAGWLEKLDKNQIEALFNRIFATADLKAELGQDIDERAGALPPERLEAAALKVSGLAGHLHKQLSLLGKLAWVLGHARKWLIKLAPPWGLVGVLVAYLLGTGYAIFAPADYLDWRQDGILDQVEGVRSIVDRELAPA